MDEELLYAMLKTDTVLLENDTLLQFYEAVKYEHTGQLSGIKEFIDLKDYEAADGMISALSSSNESEVANKQVYEILNQIEQREYYLLSDEEIELLLDLAAHCPNKYGQAVYSARVLIRTQNGYENYYWDDQEICSANIAYRKAAAKLEEKAQPEKDFIIYPNPATNELNFAVKNTADCGENVQMSIEIRDILGNLVLKKVYTEFQTTDNINIAMLANGAYIISYSCGDAVSSHHSFIIHK